MKPTGPGSARARERAGQAAIAATAFAVGAGATAGAAQLINGHDIKKDSIPLNRLTPKARKALKGARGPQGLQGATGQGTPGAAGAGGAPLLSAALALSPFTPDFISPATGNTDITESNVQVPAPRASTARSLAVALNAPATGFNLTSLTITFRANGADTPLKCVIPAGGSSCADTADTAAVGVDEELSLGVTTQCSAKCSVPGLTAGISLRLDS